MPKTTIRTTLLSSLLCLALLLTGCGTKFGYNLADWWIGWSLRSYVKLDKLQRNELKTRIETLHGWHRETQLPLYADFLDSLKTLPEQPDLNANDIESKAAAMQQMLEHTAEQAIAPLAEMIISLTDEQTTQLLANIDKKLVKYREEYVEPTPEEITENRVDFATDLIKSWAGRTTDPQHQMIRHWSDQIIAAMAMEIDGRQRWRNRLAEALPERQLNPQAIHQLTRDLLIPPAEQLQQTERERIFNNQQISYQLIANLMQSFTAKQRAHFAKEIDKLAQDLRELASQS